MLYLPVILGGALLAFFSFATTGTPIPGTGLAKLQYFREHQLPLGDKFSFAKDSLYGFYKPLILFVLLAFVSALRPSFRLLALYLAAFLVVYFILFPGGLTHYWYRYQHFVLPFLMLFAAGGLFLATGFLKRFSLGPRVVIMALLLSGVGFGLVSHLTFMRASYYEDLNLSRSVRLPLVEWLEANTLEDEVIAAHDVGILGYYSGRRILDLVGLTNREVLPYHSTRTVRSYLLDERPGYLVVLTNHDRLYLKINPRNEPENFRLLKESGPVRGGFRFRVYKIRRRPG